MVKVVHKSIEHENKTLVCGKTSANNNTSIYDQIHVSANKTWIWDTMIESEYYKYNQSVISGITAMQR